MPVIREAIYEDGSRSEINSDGTSSHDGRLAVARFALIGAKHALILNMRTGMEPRPGYLKHVAIPNIAVMTGEMYLSPSGRLTAAGKKRALRDCVALIESINASAVVVEN